MIRKATQDDCVNLAVLSLQVWLHTYANQGIRTKISNYVLSTYTENYYQDLLNKPDCPIWVYIKDEHLVGFISVDLSSDFGESLSGYEVTTLYVSEHFHGQGIGKKLLEKVKCQYGTPLWLSTWIENEKAIKFYRKEGFEIIGELNFDLDGEEHENHVLSLG